MNKIKILGWRDTLILAMLGLTISGGIAFFQRSPGYMDADYYFAGGLQLAGGKGFSEPYLWNYLDDPVGLPHPSHAYWMPFASIVAAMGMFLTGHMTWAAARIGFLVIASLIPPVAYKLAYFITNQRELAIISGLLATFSGFYSVFIPITDTFGIYLILGGLFFIIAHSHIKVRDFLLGLCAGLMHLSRADGIIWLVISIIVVLTIPTKNKRFSILSKRTVVGIIYCLIGYLFIMGAWFFRNELVFGSFLAPGGGKMLWLTSYNQIFSYPPGVITFNHWMKNGLEAALKIRLWAININLQNTLATQGNIILLPLICIGIWDQRKNPVIQIAIVAWFINLIVMSIFFPFAGARGGFFHSGAAFQLLWWSLAPLGLVILVRTIGAKRKWNIQKASRVFLIGTVGITMILTGFISVGKLYSPSSGWNYWSNEIDLYRKVNALTINTFSSNKPTVIVSNPPGFYLASGWNAIAIPDGDEMTTLTVARKFAASYLILEEGAYPEGLNELFKNPDSNANFKLIEKVEGVLVFEIIP